jgi:hypothetical protein
MDQLDALDILDQHLVELQLLWAQAESLRVLVDAHERSVMEIREKVRQWRQVAENGLLHAYGIQE